MRPIKRRSPRFEKTMDAVLAVIRSMKTKKYNELNDLLYEIRTNDLREMLPDLGPRHMFYRTLLEILRNEKLHECHLEAMYNLAVVLGEKANVPGLLSHHVIDVIWAFKGSEDASMLHHICWCFFGIAASTPESREICLKHGVLDFAVDTMLTCPFSNVIDMAGQIIYGMSHMRPVPDPDLYKPFFNKCADLLKLPEDILKYVLWSLHFVISNHAELIIGLNVTEELVGLLKSVQSSVLIPLLIIIDGVFKNNIDICDKYIEHLKGPLEHMETNVRVQACRTIADYVRNEATVQDMFDKGIYTTMIELSGEENFKVREQAVYSILRGFGLGSKKQKQDLANLGGLAAVLKFTRVALPSFSCNLLDCMETLIEEDFDFFVEKMKSIRAVPSLYKLLSYPDEAVTAKAANLLGLVGDDYRPEEKSAFATCRLDT